MSDRELSRLNRTPLELFPTQESNPTPLARVLIAGVHDELLRDRPVPREVIRVDRDVAVRYLSERELTVAEIEPAFWIERALASRIDRRPICETLSDEVIEQDDAGRIWCDELPVGTGMLAAFGSTESQSESELRLGERAALLLMERQAGGWAFQIRVTTPLLWIYDAPLVRPHVPVVGWLRLAERALAELSDAR